MARKVSKVSGSITIKCTGLDEEDVDYLEKFTDRVIQKVQKVLDV